MLHTLIGAHRADAHSELISVGWEWTGTLESFSSDRVTYLDLTGRADHRVVLNMADDHVTVRSVELVAR